MLLEYHRRGFIPGAHEEEHAFLQRVGYCLDLRNVLPIAAEESSMQTALLSCKECCPTALDCLMERYDLAPDWALLLFSNFRLAPWHGGCACIFQLKEGAPTAALLQLRTAFKKKAYYLGIYGRDELIAHELVHVCRMMLNEPKFEELLAYNLSCAPLRRLLGGLVQSSKESLLLILLLLAIIGVDLYSLYSGALQAVAASCWLKAAGLTLVAIGALRLFWRHKQLQRCLKNIAEVIQEKDRAEAVAVRLRDEEIASFACLSSQAIASYAREAATGSLRWRLIYNAYFKK